MLIKITIFSNIASILYSTNYTFIYNIHTTPYHICLLYNFVVYKIVCTTSENEYTNEQIQIKKNQIEFLNTT